jgi:hypothetical protein
MNRTKSLAALLTVALLTAAVIPAATSAAAALDVSVEQDSGTGAAMVTVTNNGTAVENATVVVESTAYEGNGTYATDANGTVDLPQPEDTQNVTVMATDDGLTAEDVIELDGDADLDLSVEQADDGNVTVTVTRADAAVENASVAVESDDEYAGTGNYSTDANGSVALVPPEENATVNVTAAAGDDVATETEALDGVEPELGVSVEQEDAGVEVVVERGDAAVENASVTVESDGDYAGEGSYQTDADGSVDLPGPETNVSVRVTAVQDDDEASVEVKLTTEFVEEEKNFGQAVEAFVDALRSAGFNGPPGKIVSDFVTTNNPGNAADAPGQEKDEQTGPQTADGESAETEDDDLPGLDEKDDAGEGERGPPEHAKNGKNVEKGDEAEADDEAGDDEAGDDEAGDDETEDDEAGDDETEDDEAGDDETEDDETGDDETEDDETEDDETEDDEADGESGPPDHANGNGDGK